MNVLNSATWGLRMMADVCQPPMAISRKYFWPKMRLTIRDFATSCDVCQRMKAANHKPLGMLQPLEWTSQKWTHITLDFTEPVPKHSRENCGILVVVDRLYKMLLVFNFRSQRSDSSKDFDENSSSPPRNTLCHYFWSRPHLHGFILEISIQIPENSHISVFSIPSRDRRSYWNAQSYDWRKNILISKLRQVQLGRDFNPLGNCLQLFHTCRYVGIFGIGRRRPKNEGKEFF